MGVAGKEKVKILSCGEGGSLLNSSLAQPAFRRKAEKEEPEEETVTLHDGGILPKIANAGNIFGGRVLIFSLPDAKKSIA